MVVCDLVFCLVLGAKHRSTYTWHMPSRPIVVVSVYVNSSVSITPLTRDDQHLTAHIRNFARCVHHTHCLPTSCTQLEAKSATRHDAEMNRHAPLPSFSDASSSRRKPIPFFTFRKIFRTEGKKQIRRKKNRNRTYHVVKPYRTAPHRAEIKAQV